MPRARRQFLSSRAWRLAAGCGSKAVLPDSFDPDHRSDQLSNEIARILNLPDVKESMLSHGLVPKASSPEEFAKFTRVQIEQLGKVVKASGARAE